MTAKTGALLTKQSEDSTNWKCLTCEYVVASRTLPYRCPRCNASRVKFVEVGAVQAETEE